MKPDRRRKSSNEVLVEIKDSETRARNYWNLRGEEANYSYSKRNNENKGLTDEISIEFNLNENRNLTEKQKQVILNTLIQKSEEDNVKNERYNLSNTQRNILLPLLLIIGAIILLSMVTGGCSSTSF